MAELELLERIGKVGGGVLFAILVLYLLRELPKILKAFSAALHAVRDQVFEVRIHLAAMLERDRRRSERRKRESTPPQLRSYTASQFAPPAPRVPSPPPKGEFDADDDTDIHTLIELEREKAIEADKPKPRGERPPRKGTHHDEE